MKKVFQTFKRYAWQRILWDGPDAIWLHIWKNGTVQLDFSAEELHHTRVWYDDNILETIKYVKAPTP